MLGVAATEARAQAADPAADGAPPAAAAGNLVTDYHGIAVADPYRPLEDVQAPATRAWADAQARFTRQRLDALPGMAGLRRQIDALDANRAPAVAGVHVTRAGEWFYLKRAPGEDVSRLYRRASANAPEQVLLDPDAWRKQTGVVHAINNYSVSRDGNHVAAVVSRNDAELGELRVYRVATGEQVFAPVPGIWGELPAAWSRDGRSVQYAQGADALTPGGKPFGKMRIIEKRLAGGAERVLIGWGATSAFESRERDWLWMDARASQRYTIAAAYEGVGGDGRIAVVATQDLARDPAQAPWRELFGTEVGVREFEPWQNSLYVRSHKDAPRYRILRYDLARPGAPPREVIPQQRGVIEGFGAAAEGVYGVVRTGAVSELLLFRHDGKPGSVQRVPLPYAGIVRLFAVQPEVRGVVITLESWSRERRAFQFDGKRVSALTLIPPSGSRVGEDWVAEESSCTSHDGAQVPMSIIHRRGLVKNGENPTLLDGYGGYGFAVRASFDPRLDAWLQRGGVFAIVDPRGGGAYGRDWYKAGVGRHKANTWKDMTACAQALIDRGYTSGAKLAIQGYSMGGVAAGRAITERPDLFQAAIIRAGITDAVRFIEATGNGPNHEDEMGTLKTPDGVKQLLAMSTYHHIRDGEKYPAVLFTAGMNDNRVAPWLAFKTFARLSAASASGWPVLLRIDGLAGHGVSSTAEQRNAELADRYAFVLWNTRDPEFQPGR